MSTRFLHRLYFRRILTGEKVKVEFSVSNDIFEFCKNNNISCDETTATEFDVLCQSLIEFNSHTNVTALKTYEDICKKHFIDSIYVLKYDLLKPGAAVIDIGCGAGFPGLPV